MSDADWQLLLLRMAESANAIAAWPASQPTLDCVRCEKSHHRTLGHLRACQGTWLTAAKAFARVDKMGESPQLKLLHPWRLFEKENYHLVDWQEHYDQFFSDRTEWNELLCSAERHLGGTLAGTQHTIESLTKRLVCHEEQHMTLLLSRTP